MKMYKLINSRYPAAILAGLLGALSLTFPAMGQKSPIESPAFLQQIQDQLSTAAGLKGETVRIVITPEKKRVMEIRPSTVRLSYGFVQNLENIDHLVSTMAHMTAHIALDYVSTPPVPESQQTEQDKISVKDYVKSAVRPAFPDKGSPPSGAGVFHNTDSQAIERPQYQNEEYNFAVNKKDILAAERELNSDKAALKILKHAGYCPSDYNRLLQYFYEHPQKMLGNAHFAVDSDQWQRLDSLEQVSISSSPCNPTQKEQASQYAAAFLHWKSSLLAHLKQNK